MKPNYIFINALSAKLGGGKTYIRNLLVNLPGDVDVYIVCPDKSILPESDHVHYIEAGFANKNILCRAFWEFFWLPFLLSRLNISVLFSPGGMDFNIFTFGVPKVTMFRNMLPFDKIALQSTSSTLSKMKNWILKSLMLRTMSQSDYIIFISQYARDAINEYISCSNSNVIYHGISDNFIPDESISIDNSILYVSRFESYKNHLNLIKAYHLMSEELKFKHKLIIIGEKMEPAHSQCVKFIKENDLSDNVVIKGRVPYKELPIYYNSCSLFVFPSSCENCPNILLEAIGSGAAILSSSTSPMPEFGRNACGYFNENDPDSISREMVRVLNDEDELNRFRQKSNELRNSYLWKKTADNTWQKLIEMAGK
ncbi:glycosyltransferase family 4 protein [Vibrio parahaemolyticus]